MDRSVLLAIVLGVLVALLALMALGWRARIRRQRDVAAPKTPPADDSGETFTGRYVATTTAGSPLDRIAAHGLGFRSLATVGVADTGIRVVRPGNDDVWIPRSDLLGFRRATWTIDRVVEPDGLDLIEWSLGGRPVDSYFRLDDAVGFRAAMSALTKENPE